MGVRKHTTWFAECSARDCYAQKELVYLAGTDVPTATDWQLAIELLCLNFKWTHTEHTTFYCPPHTERDKDMRTSYLEVTCPFCGVAPGQYCINLNNRRVNKTGHGIRHRLA